MSGAQTTGFVLMIDRAFNTLPFDVGTAAAPRGFLVARSRALINGVALASPYLAQANQQAASLGYKTGRWPLVPLTGQVVADHPGMLELTQTDWAFTDPSTASSFLRFLSKSGSGIIGAPSQPFPVRLGDESYGYLSREGPNDGSHERVVEVIVRSGSTVIQLAIRGGSSVSSGTGTGMALTALTELRSHCG